jgi:hypothetical protein
MGLVIEALRVYLVIYGRDTVEELSPSFCLLAWNEGVPWPGVRAASSSSYGLAWASQLVSPPAIPWSLYQSK